MITDSTAISIAIQCSMAHSWFSGSVGSIRHLLSGGRKRCISQLTSIPCTSVRPMTNLIEMNFLVVRQSCSKSCVDLYSTKSPYTAVMADAFSTTADQLFIFRAKCAGADVITHRPNMLIRNSRTTYCRTKNAARKRSFAVIKCLGKHGTQQQKNGGTAKWGFGPPSFKAWMTPHPMASSLEFSGVLAKDRIMKRICMNW
mmetsp:Transcript_99520/g.197220  ORF Transcript_99520/g.197220 Transcript_99520/m.197220 type:complete len:200 (-) Transcript_99520:386-985(-)